MPRPGCLCPWPAAARRDGRVLRRAQVPPTEHRVQAARSATCGYGLSAIAPGELVTGEDDDAGPDLKQTADLLFQGDGELGGVRVRAGEDHVPALDVRSAIATWLRPARLMARSNATWVRTSAACHAHRA
jgi:hypothetical protein